MASPNDPISNGQSNPGNAQGMNSGPQDSRENFQAQHSAGPIVSVEEYQQLIPIYLEVGLDYMSPLPSNATRAPIPSYTSTNRNTAVNDAFDIPICSGNVSADKRKEDLFRETYDMAIKADAVKAKWGKESGTLKRKGEETEEERKYKCGAGWEVHRRKF
jgi:hypothetical protein